MTGRALFPRTIDWVGLLVFFWGRGKKRNVYESFFFTCTILKIYCRLEKVTWECKSAAGSLLLGRLVGGRGAFPSPAWEITNYEGRGINWTSSERGQPAACDVFPAGRTFKTRKFQWSQLNKAVRKRVIHYRLSGWISIFPNHQHPNRKIILNLWRRHFLKKILDVNDFQNKTGSTQKGGKRWWIILADKLIQAISGKKVFAKFLKFQSIIIVTLNRGYIPINEHKT